MLAFRPDDVEYAPVFDCDYVGVGNFLIHGDDLAIDKEEISLLALMILIGFLVGRDEDG